MSALAACGSAACVACRQAGRAAGRQHPSAPLLAPHTAPPAATPGPTAHPPLATRPQGKSELKDHLRKLGSKDYREKLSDLHLLLWLARQPNLDPHDMAIICESVRARKAMPEGYRFIIDSLAGL